MQQDVLDNGFVRLVDYMPQENLDSSIRGENFVASSLKSKVYDHI